MPRTTYSYKCLQLIIPTNVQAFLKLYELHVGKVFGACCLLLHIYFAFYVTVYVLFI